MMAGQGDFLNDDERELIKHAPLLERARAILEIAQLRDALANMQGLVDRIRELDPETAHGIGSAALQARQHIEDLMVAPAIAVEPPEPAAPVAPVEAPVPVETIAEVEVPEVPEPEPVLTPVSEPAAEADVEDTVEHDESALPERVQRFLSKITDDPLDGLGPDDLFQIVNVVLRARAPSNSGRTPKLNYKQVLLEYFTGVDTSEIAVLQHSTVASVNQTIRKLALEIVERSGGKIELLKLLEDERDQLAAMGAAVTSDPAEAIVTPVDSVIEAPIEEAEPEAIEDLSGEPRHVQLAAALTQKLDLDGPQRAGLASLLDPKSRGDMTVNKEQVLDRIKKYVRASSGLDDEKFKLTTEERQWLYKLTGITSFYETGKDVRGASVSDIVRSLRDEAQRARVPVVVYSSLDKVFGLVKPESEPANAERTGTEG